MDIMFLSASMVSLEETRVPCCIIVSGLSLLMALVPVTNRAADMSEASRAAPLAHLSRPHCSFLLFVGVWIGGERSCFSSCGWLSISK